MTRREKRVKGCSEEKEKRGETDRGVEYNVWCNGEKRGGCQLLTCGVRRRMIRV